MIHTSDSDKSTLAQFSIVCSVQREYTLHKINVEFKNVSRDARVTRSGSKSLVFIIFVVSLLCVFFDFIFFPFLLLLQ